MIFDIIAGTGDTTGGIGSWTPAELFLGGDIGFWLDGSDYATMSQSRTAQVNVTASGQPVGQWRNKIAGQSLFNFVAISDTAIPSTKTTSGKFAVSYDGVADQLANSPLGNQIPGTGFSLFMGIKTAEVPATANTNPCYLVVTYSTLEIALTEFTTVKGQAYGLSLTSSTQYSTSAANIFGLFSEKAITPITVRVNGAAAVGAVPSAGATSFGDQHRVTADISLTADVSQAVFINRVLTPSEIAFLETYIGSKQ